MRSFIQQKFKGFQQWWLAPATTKERVLAAFIGGFGCFWIGLFARILLQSEGINIDGWLLAPIAAGALLGVLFPKATTLICFPFSTFGGGLSS